jgi:hypothetical protein
MALLSEFQIRLPRSDGLPPSSKDHRKKGTALASSFLYSFAATGMRLGETIEAISMESGMGNIISVVRKLGSPSKVSEG